MVSIPKIIGIVSCSAVLCLSLSNAAQATERMGHNPCADRKGGLPNLVKCDEEMRQGIETIKGEVLRVDGDNYFVERFDGKEVLLHIDQTTKMNSRIGQGDRIEAKVGEANDQLHVLSLNRLE
jgi:translation initiation factor IF-1